MNKIKVTNIAASPQVSELKAPISLRIDFNTLEPVAEIQWTLTFIVDSVSARIPIFICNYNQTLDNSTEGQHHFVVLQTQEFLKEDLGLQRHQLLNISEILIHPVQERVIVHVGKSPTEELTKTILSHTE